MPNETGRHAPRDVSRRNLFKQVGLAGAAAAISGTAPAVVTAAAEPAPAPAPKPQVQRLEALERQSTKTEK